MIWIDWLILLILGFNLLHGLYNGMIRSLFNILALVGAYLLTPLFKPILIGMVGVMFRLEQFLAIPIGVGLTWMTIYLTISLVGSMIFNLVNKTPLKLIDRLGGAAFGLLVSAILILLPLALVDSIPMLRDLKPVQGTLRQSIFVPMLKPLTVAVRTQAGPALINYWVRQDQEHLKPQTPPQSAKPHSTVPKKPGAK